ncbi:MAG: lytic transglycosylase domain-containing protein [Brevinema sp.]
MTRVVVLFLSIFGITVCTKSVSSYQEIVNNPMSSYREGHYRNVVESFEKNPKMADNFELQYIVASSYLELRDYPKAFQQFYKIDAEKFSQSALFPFYVRRYLQVLIALEDPDILSTGEEIVLLKLVSMVPGDSPIRPYLDNELFSVLWSTKNYPAILSLNKNLSLQGKGWRELAKSELGQAYDIFAIIKAQKSFAKNKAYSNLIKTLNPDQFRKPDDLSNLVEMTLRIPEYREKALIFAEKYQTITKDKEYYPQILSTKFQLEGNTQQAINTLLSFIDQNKNASLNFYTYTYEYLVKRKQYDLADELATAAHKIYRKDFYCQAQWGIEFHRDPQYVFNWYKENYRNIPQNQHNQVIRALIRHDLKIAEQAVDLGLIVNQDHPAFLLKYALIKEHFGKREEAYRYYLKLMFQESFSYPGIVAKQKENIMRKEFREIFDPYIKDLVTKMPKYDLKDRLMLTKAFLIDEELDDLVDQRQFKKDQQDFNNIVYADLNKVKTLPMLEKYPKSLSNFAPETQDYIENSVVEAMKGDQNWHNTARYYYKYRNLFINSSIEGYLTFRLYFYMRDQFSYTYFPNYPKDVVELAFPKPQFDLITEWSGGDKDLAYWMLSSFMAESHFRKRVYSHVGAVGFAQVMPYTAQDIKRWMKMPHLSNYDFYDNMRMGIYYHKRMVDTMDGNILLSLAAYNAGPGAVARWQKKYGFINDIYLFIEAIDYLETRNYVKIITYNHGMYRFLNDYNLY